MAEVVGVIAAAAQLAATCLSLVELARKIKGGSSSLRNYQKQLQDTRDLSQAISQNPLLQTPEVEVYIFSLLTLVNEHDLQPLFRRGRFYRSWSFMLKDRELSEISTSLERHKTHLSLIIHNLQAQAIHHIQADIKDIAMSQSPDKPTCGEHTQPNQAPTTREMPSKELVTFRRSEADPEKGSPPQQRVRLGAPSMPSSSSPIDICPEEFLLALKMANRSVEENPNSNFFYKNTARGGKMRNGNFFSNAEYPGGAGANHISLPQSIYVNNHGIDVTDLHNGHFYELCGDTRADVPQFREDLFFNNTMVSQTSGGENFGGGEIHNGNRIIMVRGRKDKGREDKNVEKQHGKEGQT
ncbi:uncharacterized protein F5Z01DRAFT_636611 [Emericellopsis atlantica]|uniref:Fungal N-terminal domain-containing protein n=1 Tax=Emericellopsis atlantica TaxID=2614577 RepID=A0A9P8CRB1_9HYPO|nr:uncharacterized protein F5Z01DRAFT_636611 [Emericellopsis atlantica]KAG9254536.1 hypothetical protein F5Z01DRAFT_636611 [Emericellopsis atlantica]